MKARSTIASRTKRLAGRTLAAAVAAGALAWLVMAGAPAGTPAGDVTAGGVTTGDVTSAEAIADEAPGFAIEDYNYPEADRILAEQGIVLKRGDGHILLADCASGTGLLEVWSREKQRVCFRATGTSGWLTLEIPSVYGIKAPEYATEVDMTVGTEAKSYDVPANSWKAVGESADEQGRPHMLVEIRTSK
ncbi:hypothetical protein [Streptomyces vilmorinianum]|uniref:hypothetical protein n=1 Tax=Streptomyces vilmorinianum TaxID=3051092 RepID=UPI0015867129|nr:hypothetical protein [Streptomyces vilmorinianum]